MSTLLLITTAEDASRSFFTTIDDVETDVLLLEEQNDPAFKSQYDYVYFRDPFVTRTYDLSDLRVTFDNLRERFESAYWIDATHSFADLLFEDKWHQYKLLSQWMPTTRQMVIAGDLRAGELAKKRISARARDIVFAPSQLLGDPKQYIIQNQLNIEVEYRVYVIRGKIQSKVAVKRPKTVDQKVKVVDLVPLPGDVSLLAGAIQPILDHLDFYGLDIARTQDGLYLLEVNRAPQFVKYNQYTGRNIAEELLQSLGTV